MYVQHCTNHAFEARPNVAEDVPTFHLRWWYVFLMFSSMEGFYVFSFGWHLADNKKPLVFLAHSPNRSQTGVSLNLHPENNHHRHRHRLNLHHHRHPPNDNNKLA